MVVFLSHWHLWSNFPPQSPAERWVRAAGDNLYDAFVRLTWPTGGHHPAVICFFVLSGFCIHYPFAQRRASGLPETGWKDYFRRRFWRIMPAYWAGCLLGLVFVIIQTRRPADSTLLELHAWAPAVDVAVRFAGASALYPREIFAGNYLLNTVAVEIVMYALYPLFRYYAARGYWLGLGVVFAVLQVVAVFLLQIVTPFWVFNSVLMLGLFWYLGAFAAHLFVTRHLRVRGIWFALAWAVFLALKTEPHFYGLNILRQDVWAVVCTLGILWGLYRESLHPDAHGRPLVAAMRYSGRISYSLYAVHTPAIMLASWVLLVLVKSSDYFVQLGTAFAFSAAATLLTYYGIERVFYRPRK